jgi:hypothetical protein
MLTFLFILAIVLGIWALIRFGLDILSFIFEMLGALLSAISGGSDDDSGGFGGGDSGGGGAEDDW